MKTTKQELGQKGEELAEKYYRDHNFVILEKNWRHNHLEVDIIVMNNEYIVFCEVKTRSYTAFGEPETFVTTQKQSNIIRAANYYVKSKNISKDVRFDIISVTTRGKEYQLHHIPDAFKPRW